MCTPFSSSQSVGWISPLPKQYCGLYGRSTTSLFIEPPALSCTRRMGTSSLMRQVRQSSSEISTNASHSGPSREAGASTRPLLRRIGLFLTGPRPPQVSPGTSSSIAEKVSPSSRLRTKNVRQSEISSPTLKNSSIVPSARRKSTGFHIGTPRTSATLTGGSQRPPMRRAVQMATSLACSQEPPNHAARTPPFRSCSSVDACALSNGRSSSTINSCTKLLTFMA